MNVNNVQTDTTQGGDPSPKLTNVKISTRGRPRLPLEVPTNGSSESTHRTTS